MKVSPTLGCLELQRTAVDEKTLHDYIHTYETTRVPKILVHEVMQDFYHQRHGPRLLEAPISLSTGL